MADGSLARQTARAKVEGHVRTLFSVVERWERSSRVLQSDFGVACTAQAELRMVQRPEGLFAELSGSFPDLAGLVEAKLMRQTADATASALVRQSQLETYAETLRAIRGALLGLKNAAAGEQGSLRLFSTCTLDTFVDMAREIAEMHEVQLCLHREILDCPPALVGPPHLAVLQMQPYVDASRIAVLRAVAASEFGWASPAAAGRRAV